MLVAIVTAPCLPACDTISASNSWYLALSTLCLMPFFLSISLISSDVSIVIVPTRTGCPFSCDSITESTTASNLAFLVLYTTSFKSFLNTGLFVGISTTSML